MAAALAQAVLHAILFAMAPLNRCPAAFAQPAMSDKQHPQLVLDILPAPEPTLDNFVAGPNTEVVDALRHLGAGRAIYLWGPAGCGRTHLVRAMVGKTPGALRIDAAASQQTLLRLVEARLPPLVAIDDIQELDAARQASVFALYNRWRESAATSRATTLVVTGDRAPLQMPLREDLRTRLGWDLVFRLELLADADKLAALRAHAASRALEVTPELFDWLLTRYARDIRRLTALLDALDRYSLATKRPITLPLLKTMLAENPPANPY